MWVSVSGQEKKPCQYLICEWAGTLKMLILIQNSYRKKKKKAYERYKRKTFSFNQNDRYYFILRSTLKIYTQYYINIHNVLTGFMHGQIVCIYLQNNLLTFYLRCIFMKMWNFILKSLNASSLVQSIRNLPKQTQHIWIQTNCKYTVPRGRLQKLLNRISNILSCMLKITCFGEAKAYGACYFIWTPYQGDLVWLMVSMKLSEIQAFIYVIAWEKTLRTWHMLKMIPN